MRFVSTRGKAPPSSFAQALSAGIAGDGGLFVPEAMPVFDAAKISSFGGGGRSSLAELGQEMLEPWVKGEVDLKTVCRRAFDFPAPLAKLSEGTEVLELFHGPTLAFKDFGARFLAECLSLFPGPEHTVLVATSGDTGGAVAAAFHRRKGFRVVILYPKGKVSARQEAQLSSWGENVRALRVSGDFDDCQRMVKAAFADRGLKELTSANSISIGRLLPQTVYYAHSSLEYLRRAGAQPGFIVPTGNLGNALAALWAKAMGFPIREVVLACNSNRAIPDFFKTGRWEPRATIPTLANAMDVGSPSNMERLRHLYPGVEEMRKDVKAFSISDAEIRATIQEGFAKWGRIFCPHTATAVCARKKLGGGDWIIVSTAHPAKFESIVEPLIGKSVEIPPALQAILGRPSHFEEIGNDPRDLKAKL